MKLNPKQRELATKRLWELQETFVEFEGIILASVGGLTLTSTLPNGAQLQRGAALSAALLLLCEHVMQTWSGDETEAVYVKVNLDEPPPRYVVLHPVGNMAVLIAIQRTDAKLAPPYAMIALKEAVAYLETILQGV
jgi:predicted regulator of Ras-like GTPase activity (Roadblock/LC7/MglB family)